MRIVLRGCYAGGLDRKEICRRSREGSRQKCLTYYLLKQLSKVGVKDQGYCHQHPSHKLPITHHTQNHNLPPHEHNPERCFHLRLHMSQSWGIAPGYLRDRMHLLGSSYTVDRRMTGAEPFTNTTCLWGQEAVGAKRHRRRKSEQNFVAKQEPMPEARSRALRAASASSWTSNWCTSTAHHSSTLGNCNKRAVQSTCTWIQKIVGNTIWAVSLRYVIVHLKN